MSSPPGPSSPPTASDAETPPINDQQDENEHQHDPFPSLPTPLTPGTSNAPPYWLSRHSRTVSSVSYHSITTGSHTGGPILLEDHSAENHELAQGCWAKSASVDEYVLVSGLTGVGAYVVWHCTVRMLKGGDLVIRKR